MKVLKLTYILLALIISFSCTSSDSIEISEPEDEGLYFPPINSEIWETSSLSELNWNENALQPLLNFLDDSETKAFIILKDGRIVVESYFNGTTSTTNNPWFSAGKTLTAFMVGIAQEEGFLSLTDPSNTYLGENWSSLSDSQENAITVENHITMTTGLDYRSQFACTDPECLTYLNAPGGFWYYHNAPYTLTQSIVSGAVNSDFDSYFNEKLRNRIGMQGVWIPFGFNKFYLSNARSMARFGLLCLNKGVWEQEAILNDENYFNSMTNTSQPMNPSYGYLWWLNGKSSHRVPSSETLISGTLIPNAPSDLIAGLGANDQKLYVIPSENLVIIRMGSEGNEGQLGPSSYDNILWEKINDLIN
ncbi:serine hydrolase domain-containing protein [Winogradskyella immobilis]|uniref:Serine hydrolase n=1 Tax=Winogradskyella immobilis TaxID=2816852 RepID=A0ABS8EPK5_9FLAO|nr:serine hydrolase [Winogradskyella immobilis]MCC1485149.1 serine hydrolase [Winogradskyella immobilis]MCG0017241.1 serine hydrolase [Winogradskyella immobilis]